jgi:hypothetical protein
MIKRLLKPLLLLTTLVALIWGSFLLPRPDSPEQIAESQIEIMREALLSLETFNDDGDPLCRSWQTGDLGEPICRPPGSQQEA